MSGKPGWETWLGNLACGERRSLLRKKNRRARWIFSYRVFRRNRCSVRSIRPRGMPAGRPEDDDKDSGYGPIAREALKEKAVSVGKFYYVSSKWRPHFCIQSALNDGKKGFES
jgi:hypothetical protein